MGAISQPEPVTLIVGMLSRFPELFDLVEPQLEARFGKIELRSAIFDFDFTRSDRLVCTEVVYRSYEGLGGLSFTLTRRTGRLTLSAEDLLAMSLRSQGSEPVAAYAPGFTNRLQWSAGAVETLRRTLEDRK